ncbi:MAG TPA: prephenate dehydratase [Candidatus Saccharimonadales bacterium]|nr:prephenate dehydratase [Candidatus Saccharimonadales bacterium]
MSTTVAIQGDNASFHDIAAAKFFGKETERVFCDTFSDTFSALATDKADVALCAIENSLYGSINDVYDLLFTYNFQIVGEVYLRIEQCLVGMPGTKLDAIAEVYSHPVALAQCERYLDMTLPGAKRMEHHDTAASVQLISTLKKPSVAAIAGRQAAELYGMEILASSIETDSQNYTRFVVLSKQPTVDQSLNKTSLVIRTNHTPGALYAALGCFAKRDINLTKLQSRPVMGSAWNYIFYIDVAIGNDAPLFTQAIDQLNAQGCDVTVLGSYISG